MSGGSAFDEAGIRELEVVRARSEAASLRGIVRYRDGEEARIAGLDSPMRRMVEKTAIATTIGAATGRSDGQVINLLAMADRVMAELPQVWDAFGLGEIDQARVQELSRAVAKLERDESKARLDDQGPVYARTHTVAELRAWLRRFVVRVEADLAIERAEAEREKRHVNVVHVDDSMAWLTAYLPSHQAAAIAARLRRHAKRLRADGDPRTLDQLRADLLADAAMRGDLSGETPGMGIDIAVLIDDEAVTGQVDGLAESADGEWSVPAEWILEAGAADGAFWHRVLIDPFTGDTLRHEYAGYSPPDLLRRAIVLRDGTCRTPGCVKPAAECDLDHHIPWPRGHTSGENLRSRCRKHHAQKSHGVLPIPDDTGVDHRLPPWRPDEPSQTPTVIEIYLPGQPLHAEYAGLTRPAAAIVPSVEWRNR